MTRFGVRETQNVHPDMGWTFDVSLCCTAICELPKVGLEPTLGVNQTGF